MGHSTVVVQFMVSHSNIDLPTTTSGKKLGRTIDGVTSFLKAIEKGYTDVVNILISTRCDVNF